MHYLQFFFRDRVEPILIAVSEDTGGSLLHELQDRTEPAHFVEFASVVGHHVWLNAARVRMARLLLEMGEPPFARSEIRPSQQYQADDSAEPDLEEVRWDVTFWVADIPEPVVTSEISGHDWIEIYTSCDCSEQFLVVTDEDGEDLLLSVADIDVLCGLEIDRYSSAQLGSLSRVVVYKEV